MPFQKEPEHQHGSVPQVGIVLVNLGTPDEPTPEAVRRYLKEFLSDPRVVEIPRAIWWIILNLFILPFRSKKSAKKYEQVWTAEGSPLRVHTQKQAMLLRGLLGERGHTGVKVVMAMRYGTPSLRKVLNQLKAERCERIVVLPAYPQYSGTTTASIFDAVFSHYAQVRSIPELRLVRNYHDHEGYIDALCENILQHWAVNGRGEKLLMSFHGIPERNFAFGDPYHCECYKTGRLVAAKLGLSAEQYLVTFQSRFGRGEWLQPYTAATVAKLARDGLKRLDVVCPGFVGDCLETLEEINMEVRHDFTSNGGQEFHYIPCLNESPLWIRALADIAEQQLLGWPTRLTPAQQEVRTADYDTGRQHAEKIGF